MQIETNHYLITVSNLFITIKLNSKNFCYVVGNEKNVSTHAQRPHITTHVNQPNNTQYIPDRE